ncbi:vWA domain-containing protein [Undibacterium umbellatum]|uniref:VWA domain-containing protein n=1 Tax=Undibacterium umbellatum TaxID=2762300 RepID=A0ABR6Z7H0_9BURK|nr:VWA domain-containing protein [Undibacterium umbellatum]MBC3907695.1 VWA domain-containing protein [Undibacterium umbellatum]
MRKLPVYLLLDSSGSMHGEPIEAVRNGLQTLVAALRQDPHALESAYLSVITFADAAQQVVPLTELSQFQIPTITASGTTAMGTALSLLVECISREVAVTSAEVKGDWKPIVFLMTDGEATDDMTNSIAELKKAKVGTFIACAAGPNANTSHLSQITDSVVKLDTADSNTIKAFFKWVSASIATTSQKVDLQKKETTGLSDLPPPPPEVNVVL